MSWADHCTTSLCSGFIPFAGLTCICKTGYRSIITEKASISCEQCPSDKPVRRLYLLYLCSLCVSLCSVIFHHTRPTSFSILFIYDAFFDKLSSTLWEIVYMFLCILLWNLENEMMYFVIWLVKKIKLKIEIEAVFMYRQWQQTGLGVFAAQAVSVIRASACAHHPMSWVSH